MSNIALHRIAALLRLVKTPTLLVGAAQGERGRSAIREMGNLLPLFLLFLFWGGINFSQEVLSEQVRPNKHQSATKDIQETANNEKDNPSQFEIELLKTLRAIADNEKSAYEQNNANAKSWNSPGIIVNIGLLIVGSLYTIFAFLQWRAIRHQAQFMQEGLEISRQSAKAAQDSADAATKSAGIAEAALKLTERAYITVRDWQWSSPEAAHPGTISCFLVNNGRTPAQRISYFVHRIVDGKPANIPSDYRKHLMTGGQDMTIPAQDRYQIFVDRNDPLLPHYWGLVKTGATSLYAFTHIEYDDVFGERYEVGSLATYDYRVQRFRVHENPGYNYNRKKNA